MKKLTVLFFCIAAILFFSTNIIARPKQTTKIASVKQKNKTVAFTITAVKPFRMGGNRYILHIGNKEFLRSTQSANNGKGSITFLIPADDYKSLEAGNTICLTYGHSNGDGEDLDDLIKQKDPNCWPLGKFNKHLLTK